MHSPVVLPYLRLIVYLSFFIVSHSLNQVLLCTMKVLITGGSGYLGQFLLVALRSQHEVAYTYLDRQLDPDSCSGVQAFQVNIATGEGLTEAVLDWKPQVVVNCAAVSQPASCEQNYEACRALNRPYRLVEALQQLQEQQGMTALLIHLSTDQVSCCWQ